MPYKISEKGIKEFELVAADEDSDLTLMQEQALRYLFTLSKHDSDTRYVHASEIAEHYNYPNGQYFRGVLASLHKKGLLLKKED